MFRPRFAGLLMGIALLPMVAPPVVSALTLYFFLIKLSNVNDVGAYDTLLGVVLAHSVMILPFAVVLVSVSLARVDRRMDLAARAIGASLATRVFKVILPNIRFSVIVSFFLTFVLSWEEIAVARAEPGQSCRAPVQRARSRRRATIRPAQRVDAGQSMRQSKLG